MEWYRRGGTAEDRWSLELPEDDNDDAGRLGAWLCHEEELVYLLRLDWHVDLPLRRAQQQC